MATPRVLRRLSAIKLLGAAAVASPKKLPATALPPRGKKSRPLPSLIYGVDVRAVPAHAACAHRVACRFNTLALPIGSPPLQVRPEISAGPELTDSDIEFFKVSSLLLAQTVAIAPTDVHPSARPPPSSARQTGIWSSRACSIRHPSHRSSTSCGRTRHPLLAGTTPRPGSTRPSWVRNTLLVSILVAAAPRPAAICLVAGGLHNSLGSTTSKDGRSGSWSERPGPPDGMAATQCPHQWQCVH